MRPNFVIISHTWLQTLICRTIGQLRHRKPSSADSISRRRKAYKSLKPTLPRPEERPAAGRPVGEMLRLSGAKHFISALILIPLISAAAREKNPASAFDAKARSGSRN